MVLVLLSWLPYASTYGLLLLLLLLLCLGVPETIMGVKMIGSYMYKESHSLVYTQFPAAFPSLYFSWCFFSRQHGFSPNMWIFSRRYFIYIRITINKKHEFIYIHVCCSTKYIWMKYVHWVSVFFLRKITITITNKKQF
jgi:hypothetical protein